MSTINVVRYFFYKNAMPKDKARLERMVALAYQTARDRKLHPKAILIRSDFHDTTTVNGKNAKDPSGWHVTLCYKDKEQLESGSHVACHAYTAGKDIWDLVESTHAGEKSDDTPRRHNKKPVWPSWDELEEAPEIGYGHLPDE
ncbi:hypothetical protein ANO14919_082420 [Xylariales sp. No.14919]|nr:hypothetical protein ANO14919_082420 [Xylariales sp. No.14919]